MKQISGRFRLHALRRFRGFSQNLSQARMNALRDGRVGTQRVLRTPAAGEWYYRTKYS